MAPCFSTEIGGVRKDRQLSNIGPKDGVLEAENLLKAD